MKQPPFEVINAKLAYDPDTGLLHWRIKPCNSMRAGDKAGSPNPEGYWSVGMKPYGLLKAHRLAWLLTHGTWPVGQIDHINGNPADNRIANLRDAIQSINKENTKRPYKNNKAGFLGVSPAGNRWRAVIQVRGKSITNLGCFGTPQLAHEAYLKAKRALHEGNNL